MKWCWILSKSFYESIELIKWFFIFASINVMYYIYRFAYVEPPFNPWHEADLVMVYELSDVLLESGCHYFIEDFCINVN
jgi:hypothetical protein